MKKSMQQLGDELLDKDRVGNELSHDEHLRANALSLAARYYVETIVKDGDLYREMVRDNKVLKPATYFGVIEVAFAFEAFIKGELARTADAVIVNEIDEVTKEDRGIAVKSPEAQ